MAADDSCKLFVAGLPDSVTEEGLRKLFEESGGTVAELSLPKDRATGRSRGYGFVTFATADQARAALRALDGTMHGGKSISVRPFQSDPPRREAGPRGGDAGGGRDRTLYVGNLPYDVTQEEVEALVASTQAGPVARVNLPLDPESGRKRGFGFVTMGTADGARQALDALRGAELRGRRLVVNIALPKGERPSRPEPGFADRGPGPDAGGPLPDPRGGPPHDRRFPDRRRGGGAGPSTDGEGARRRNKPYAKERNGGRVGRESWRDWDDDDDRKGARGKRGDDEEPGGSDDREGPGGGPGDGPGGGPGGGPGDGPGGGED